MQKSNNETNELEYVKEELNAAEAREIIERLRDFSEKTSVRQAAYTMGISRPYAIKLLAIERDEDLLPFQKSLRSIQFALARSCPSWYFAETSVYTRLYNILSDSKRSAMVYAVVGRAGGGKSLTCREFCRENEGSFHISCSEFWTRSDFLREILSAMKIRTIPSSVYAMMQIIIDRLRRILNPIIILDEADKLSPSVLNFFITIFNELEDNCGMVLIATEHLEKRIVDGVRRQGRGLNEIFSRIGRRFIPLPLVSESDVAAVCRANGVSDTKDIVAIYDDCENDIRRVKRKIHTVKNRKTKDVTDGERIPAIKPKKDDSEKKAIC